MTRDEIAHIMQDTSGLSWGDEAHFQRFAELIVKAYRVQVNVPRTPLEKAAKDVLQLVDYMLRNGEWYQAQERADALRAALAQPDQRISDDPIYIASDGGFYPMPRQSKPEQRCEYIRSSGSTHWCALAEAGPKEKNHA